MLIGFLVALVAYVDLVPLYDYKTKCMLPSLD